MTNTIPSNIYNKTLDMVSVYILTENDIPFYVGKTKNIKRRFSEHKRTYGQYVKIEEIDRVEDNNWIFWERFYVQKYKKLGYSLKNKNKGGGGPSFYTRETRLKMSTGRKNKGMGKNPKISDAKKGVSRNITWGDKISEAKTGSPKKGKSILQIDPITNKIVNIFSSITEARKTIGSNGIPNALKGISKTSGGYIWRYKE
jgi:hypothetical protein